ncbi:methyltransferase domain-containing protein [Rhodobacteraceae bacterium NNCM2]|nr:methyltransferase domain-containing protein [Coraliihabitans acroporae]
MPISNYVIRGGEAGRERLRLLSRILQPQTASLLGHVGLAPGMKCLDIGCGGGDVTVEIARVAGPGGLVVGCDLDAPQLDIARREAAALGLTNIRFEQADAMVPDEPDQAYDLVFARMILCHVPHPARVLDSMIGHVRPGGTVVAEDIDFRGHFTSPDCPELTEYMAIVYRIMRNRGGEPDLGPALPPMLKAHGLRDVGMRVAQVAAMTGESKLIHAVTMEAVADVAIADGLTTAAEAARIASALYRFAERDDTVMSLPRYIQTWGTKPG